MSSPIKQRLQDDLNQARKARDKERTLVLSTAISEVRNREIDGKEELDDDGVIAVLSKAVKQRRDAADQFREAGRDELAEKEEVQMAILQKYLPQPLSTDDVRAMVREILASGTDQMGAVMGRLMPKIRGRFEGGEANRIVREEMSS